MKIVALMIFGWGCVIACAVLMVIAFTQPNVHWRFF